jgi:hypothetical protein
MSDDLRRAWEAQTVEERAVDVARVRVEAVSFERQIRRRNTREYAAGVFVVAAFGAVAFVAPDPLGRLGAALIAVGAVSVMASLARRGSGAPLPDALGAPTLAWRRAELTRQRDLLAGIWRWYLGPLVPGMVLFLASAAWRAETAGSFAVVGATALAGVAVFGAIARANHAAAAELDRELAALDGR